MVFLNERDRLIIFTRYPEAGQTKTRLIPALGARGAAELHRQLTERTLQQARTLQGLHSIAIEVRFTGGTAAQMQQWLGSDSLYQPQGEGDLGDRLSRASEAAFRNGSDRILIVGTDCPDADAAILSQAFDRLQHYDLVLGPAADGGYYAIGLRRSIPELFQGIDWGTNRVLQQTRAIARDLSLSVADLPQLRDIDRPEDLEILPPHLLLSPQPAKISIVIPVLNEAAHLRQTLQRASTGSHVEIIVVDGGSLDSTCEIAESFGVKPIRSEPGRAVQMNAGAAVAEGEILLFLHGDTQLPEGFEASVRSLLQRPGVVAGAFNLKIDSPKRSLRGVEIGVKWRSRWLQMPYGDQGIFIRRDRFQQMGGFAQLPIMEDFEFVRRLQQIGRIAIAPESVLTSPRRWEKLGVLQTTLINQSMILGYFLGRSPERLAHWYRTRALN